MGLDLFLCALLTWADGSMPGSQLTFLGVFFVRIFFDLLIRLDIVASFGTDVTNEN